MFNHLSCALTDLDTTNAKYDKIREINNCGQTVGHIIVRHGLTELEAFQIEASLIDTLSYCGILLSNQVGGHNSIEKGLMTSEEIIRLYNAEPLEKIDDNCILININKKYQRGKGESSIYSATKETWTIRKDKLPNLKYILSEYRGLVVEVYEVRDWYEKERGFTSKAKRHGQTKIGFGFNGEVASDEIRKKYYQQINRSHKKERCSISN